MTEIRWAVVGLGVGAEHARAIAALEGSRLVAVADHDPMVAQAIAHEVGVEEIRPDLDSILSTCEVDAVVIATYDDSHSQLAVQALRAGLHVFVEKPLATTAQGLRDVTEALSRSPHLRMTTNTLLRLSPRFRALKEDVASGRFGRLYHLEMTYLYGRVDKLLRGWRGTHPGYSVTLGGTIHMIDLMLWLTGERPVRCQGVGSSLGSGPTQDQSQRQPAVQDLRVALLEFPSGLTAQVGANFACVFPHFHSVALFGSEATYFNYPQLQGTSMTSGHVPEAMLFTSRDPSVPPTAIKDPYPAVPKGSLIPLFAEEIRGGHCVVSEQEAVDAVTVALSIDEAVRSGAKVEINYTPINRPDLRNVKDGW